MGVNDVNLPTNCRSDEEAIQYLASMVSALKTNAYVAKTGAGPFTLTAAEMIVGVIEFSGSTTAVTVTTDTAAAIIARMQALDANAGVGSTASFNIVNDNTSSGAITLAAGASVTLLAGAATSTIAIGIARRYQAKILTASTVSIGATG